MNYLRTLKKQKFKASYIIIAESECFAEAKRTGIADWPENYIKNTNKTVFIFDKTLDSYFCAFDFKLKPYKLKDTESFYNYFHLKPEDELSLENIKYYANKYLKPFKAEYIYKNKKKQTMINFSREKGMKKFLEENLEK